MADRTDGGLFQPGHSIKGGRKAGPTKAEQVANYLAPHIQKVLDKAIDLAAQGDPASMKLILERYAPPAKQEDEKVLVPGFASAPSLEAKSVAVMSAIASGEISANAGQRLLQALETHTRIVTASEVEQRLAALEQRSTHKAITTTKATVIDAGSGAIDDATFEDIA